MTMERFDVLKRLAENQDPVRQFAIQQAGKLLIDAGVRDPGPTELAIAVPKDVTRESVAKIKSKIFKIVFESEAEKFINLETAKLINEMIGPSLSNHFKLEDLIIPNKEERRASKQYSSYDDFGTIRRGTINVSTYNRVLRQLMRSIAYEQRDISEKSYWDLMSDLTVGDLRASKTLSKGVKGLSPSSLAFVEVMLKPASSEKPQE